MKTLIAAILFAGLNAASAYPVLGTTGFQGLSSCHPAQKFSYTCQFDNAFGGHWQITSAHDQDNKNGTRTESFRGTVSDTSLNGAYTQSNFDWIADGWKICPQHSDVLCSSFSITLKNGTVTGTATFTP